VVECALPYMFFSFSQGVLARWGNQVVVDQVGYVSCMHVHLSCVVRTSALIGVLLQLPAACQIVPTTHVGYVCCVGWWPAQSGRAGSGMRSSWQLGISTV
jgi:hypothetical protein